MSLKLKPTNIIKTRLGIQKNGPVHAFLTQTCADYMDKYVPFASGMLAYKNRKVKTNVIIYDSPYAHYMYKGLVMGPNVPIKENDIIVGWFSPMKPKYYTGKQLNYNASAGHEYAGPRWDKRMWSAEKNDVIKEVEEFIKRGVK